MDSACGPSETHCELNKLLRELQDADVQRSPTQRRHVISKVIGYMTMGIDTSCLFTQMILACETTDFVSKKLVYLYLSNHAEKNPEVALLCVNTLLKECKEQSPVVRGLALRSLSSLRLPQLFEYLFPVLREAFSDASPYVRKTACICALKVFRTSPSEFYRHEFFDNVVGALHDGDGLVLGNALVVLLEVSREAEVHGRVDKILHVTQPLLYHLLNNMKRVSEYHRVQIISLIHKYTPRDEEEMYDIMNLLDEQLQTQNSGTVLAVCKAFFHLTQNNLAMHSEVLSRLKAPLLTLVSSCSTTEALYAVLCHIKLLLLREPLLFQDSYKSFYCRRGDPTYIKAVKMDILTLLVTTVSAEDILSEFVAYACERGGEAVQRMSTEAIGRIPLKLPVLLEPVAMQLIALLDSCDDYVRNTSIRVMRDVLQKHRNTPMVHLYLEKLVAVLPEMDLSEPESSLAVVWFLGEYGEHIEEAPYILEEMCDGFLLKRPSEFLRQLLTSSLMLFFKRPPEMQHLLGKLFRRLVNDFTYPDVQDLARLYYRLLQESPEVASHVICAPKSEIVEFAGEQDTELWDKLFEKFNTLDVVYFRQTEGLTHELMENTEDENDSGNVSDEGAANEESPNECQADATRGGNTGDCPQFPVAVGFGLAADASMELHEFEHLWTTIDNTEKTTVSFQLQLRSTPDIETFEDTLDLCGVVMLTAGPYNDGHRCFLYAQEEGVAGVYFLLEACLARNGVVDIRVKSESPHMQHFLHHFRRILAQF